MVCDATTTGVKRTDGYWTRRRAYRLRTDGGVWLTDRQVGSKCTFLVCVSNSECKAACIACYIESLAYLTETGTYREKFQSPARVRTALPALFALLSASGRLVEFVRESRGWCAG